MTLRLQSLIPESKAQDLAILTARLQPISQLRLRAALLQGKGPSFVDSKWGEALNPYQQGSVCNYTLKF